MTLARAYEPYGDVLSTAGNEVTNYAFTGEWQDGRTGLIYLRARWLATQTGRFLTQDAWGGNAHQPMSYNAWLYVYGNPVIRTDPSGRIPDEDGINRGRYVYSCNCGWIDFAHANPSLPNDIFRKLKSHPVISSNPKVRQDALLYNLIVENPLISLGFAVYPVVKYPPNDQDQDAIALGMHIYREEFRESLQCLPLVPGQSCFSEEDLTSNLIGFYMAVNGIEGDSLGNGSREWLASICGFPLEKEGVNGARVWSLGVFENYGDFSEGVSGIREWGSPRLIQTPEISSYCDNKSGVVCTARMWPAAFSTITPEKPKVNGKWWKYRGEEDGWLVPTNVAEVYGLYVPECKWPW